MSSESLRVLAQMCEVVGNNIPSNECIIESSADLKKLIFEDIQRISIDKSPEIMSDFLCALTTFLTNSNAQSSLRIFRYNKNGIFFSLTIPN